MRQLIGTFLPEKLSENCYKDITGSHHNNWLSVCKNNKKMERLKKILRKKNTYQNLDLHLEITFGSDIDLNEDFFKF